MADEAWAGLAEAINAIRSELSAAIKPNEGVRFTGGPVELEFTVDVRKDAHGKVKVALVPWFSAEAAAGGSIGKMHRLKVTLQPVEAEASDDGSGGDRSGGFPGRPNRPVLMDKHNPLE